MAWLSGTGVAAGAEGGEALERGAAQGGVRVEW